MRGILSAPWWVVGLALSSTIRWTWRWWTTGNPAWFLSAGCAAAVLLFTVAYSLAKEPR